MITLDFKGGGTKVVFADSGNVFLPTSMNADEFVEFMALAIHVYHSRMPQFGCAPQATYSDMGGKLVNGRIPKKRGRPATKSATVKRGRPRRA